MRLRKDVNVYLYDPSGKFFNVVVELKNSPGALASVLQVLEEMKINILGSFSSVEPSARTGVWSAFVEGSRSSSKKLKKSISSLPQVLDSVVVESKNGFLVDGIHYPLALNTGERALMMRARYIITMFERIRRTFGSGGRTIVFDEGFAYGKGTGLNYKARLGEKFVNANLKEVLKLYQAYGWFKLEGVETNGRSKSVTVRTTGNFECEGAKSTSPNSEFVRGHLSGALTAILGVEMRCRETKCIAAGSDECVFVGNPKGEIGELEELSSVPAE